MFETRGPQGSDLWILDRSTSHEARLTPPESSDWSALPSPDGRRIAFLSRRTGDYEIHVMPVDGGDAVNLTNHPDYDVLGAWSPEGDRIAFMSTRGYDLGGADGPFPGHVYVMAADGSGLRQVTREPLTSSVGPSDWSPDGRWLLTGRDVDGQIDLFLLDAETGAERRLTEGGPSEYGGTFSRDGARVAFHADDGQASRIVVLNVDGTGRRVLTPGPGFHYTPRWSPDDAWLLVTRLGEDGDVEQYDVVAVSVADGTVEPILATSRDERGGHWLDP